MSILPILNRILIQNQNKIDFYFRTSDLDDGFQLEILPRYPISQVGLMVLIIPERFIKFLILFENFNDAISIQNDENTKKLINIQTFEGTHKLDNFFFNTINKMSLILPTNFKVQTNLFQSNTTLKGSLNLIQSAVYYNNIESLNDLKISSILLSIPCSNPYCDVCDPYNFNECLFCLDRNIISKNCDFIPQTKIT